MAYATINDNGQISIPAEILHSLGVDAGDRVEFVQLEPGKVLLLAASRSVTELKGMVRRSSQERLHRRDESRHRGMWNRGAVICCRLRSWPTRLRS